MLDLKELKILAMEKLDNMCAVCGYSDWRALKVEFTGEEIYGRRRSERKMYKEILEGSKNYRLICANCKLCEFEETHRIYKILAPIGKDLEMDSYEKLEIFGKKVIV